MSASCPDTAGRRVHVREARAARQRAGGCCRLAGQGAGRARARHGAGRGATLTKGADPHCTNLPETTAGERQHRIPVTVCLTSERPPRRCRCEAGFSRWVPGSARTVTMRSGQENPAAPG